MKSILVTTITAVLLVVTAAADPIHDAAINGDFAIIQAELDKGIDVNVKSEKGLTAFHIAVISGNYDLVQFLINEGSNINVIFFQDYHLETETGLDRNDFIDKINTNNSIPITALHSALQFGHRDIVELLLKEKVDLGTFISDGSDLNTKDKWGLSYLHKSVYWGYKPILIYLLSENINVNLQDNYGRTALHEAVLIGDIEVIDILINSGAKVTLKDRLGLTPLDLAQNNSEILNLLDPFKLYISRVGLNNKSLNPTNIYEAVECGNVDAFIKFFDSREFPINHIYNTVSSLNRDEKYLIGTTLLHLATLMGHYEIVKLLISNGANLNKRTSNITKFTYTNLPLPYLGESPLHIASKYGRHKIAELLISSGAKINIQCSDGLSVLTPLDIAIKLDKKRIISLLRNNGGKINAELSIIQAVLSGSVYWVNEHLSRGQSANRSTKKYTETIMTILHYSVLQNNYNIVQLLLDNGADINSRSGEGMSALHYAVRDGYMDIIKLIISYDADLNLISRGGREIISGQLLKNLHNTNIIIPSMGMTPVHYATLTPLHYALWHKGDIAIAKVLLDNGADLNIRSSHELLPLHYAAMWGYLNYVELFITKGAKINSKSIEKQIEYNDVAMHIDESTIVQVKHTFTSLGGMTPLHFAVSNSHLKTVNYLITNESNVNARNNKGQTPLDFAKDNNIITILIDNGGKTGLVMAAEESIYLSAKYGNLSAIKEHLANGVNVNSKDDAGMMPLHFAVNNKHLEIIEFLIANGANVNERNNKNETPLDLASSNNITTILIDNGAMSGLVMAAEESILFAAKYGNLNAIKEHLANGVNVNTKNDAGMVSLHFAVRRAVEFLNSHFDPPIGEHLEIIEILIANGANVNERNNKNETPLDLSKNNFVSSTLRNHGGKSSAELLTISKIVSRFGGYGIRFKSVKEKSYTVEVTQDLKTWKELVKVNGNGSWKTVRFTAAQQSLMQSKHEFFRVKFAD
ncbi:ankyrin repeat domain-containing protein [bacterium]|nr:ankyrin repeat domain-containing protein [bacterium]